MNVGHAFGAALIYHTTSPHPTLFITQERFDLAATNVCVAEAPVAVPVPLLTASAGPRVPRVLSLSMPPRSPSVDSTCERVQIAQAFIEAP